MNEVQSRTSVHDRLQALPDVFDLTKFELVTGIDRTSAKVMLSRWMAKGYIEGAGPKAGIYFKRLGAQMDRSEQIEAAVRFLYPQSAVCAATVLHRSGWTTQVPRELHVAVETRPTYVQLHGVVLHPRPQAWFATVEDKGGFANQPLNMRQGLRWLKPAWALQDMRANPDGWVPDEDDLDVPSEQGAARELDLAQTVLMASEPRPATSRSTRRRP